MCFIRPVTEGQRFSLFDTLQGTGAGQSVTVTCACAREGGVWRKTEAGGQGPGSCLLGDGMRGTGFGLSEPVPGPRLNLYHYYLF